MALTGNGCFTEALEQIIYSDDPPLNTNKAYGRNYNPAERYDPWGGIADVG